MARSMNRLGVKDIERALRSGKAQRKGDGGGLWLQVAGSASSWLFRYSSPVSNKQRAMGLGPVDPEHLSQNLAEARLRAAGCRTKLWKGIDPIDAREAEKTEALIEASQSITFKAAAEQYVSDHRAGWRNEKHADQWASSLTAYAYPTLEALPVSRITSRLLADALRPIWTIKVETANRVRGRIETILDWTAAQGYRPTGNNPAELKIIKNLLPARDKSRLPKHHAALPYPDIGDLVQKLRKLESVGARALLFTILTVARTGESLGARWTEIDTRARVWSVPASRMKGHRDHRVPLTDEAISVIEMVRGLDNDLLFPGMRAGHQMSENTMALVLKRLGCSATVHGMRATFKTWSSEQTSTAPEIVEMCLAHTVGSEVERAYQRSDLLERRRRHMEAWERFCLTSFSESDAKVVLIRQAT